MKKKQITAAIPAVLLVLGLILAGCPQATGGGGDDPIPLVPDDATVYTVSFNSDGGSRTPDPQRVPNGGTVTEPGYIYKADSAVYDWFKTSDFSDDPWDFENDTVSADMTLYAYWGLAVTDVSNVGTWLGEQTEAGTASDPKVLTVSLDMAQAGSGWQDLLAAIDSKRAHVFLDLLHSIMNGTAFDPDPSYSTGKSYIVNMRLPSAAKSIVGGTASNPSFKHFSNLVAVGAAYSTDIGDYAFAGCTSLEEVVLGSAARIGKNVFQNTGTTGLYIYLGVTPPAVGIDLFSGVPGTKNVTVSSRSGAATAYGVDEYSNSNSTSNNWGNAFRGKGWNGTAYQGGTVNTNVQLNFE